MAATQCPEVNDSGFASYPAGAALGLNLRVVLTAGELQLAGSTAADLGTTIRRAFAQGDDTAIRLATKEGYGLFVASEAIDAGNPFYAAANGKVAASGSLALGIAVTTTTADGQTLAGLRKNDAAIAAAVGGTTAAAFLVDSDSSAPKIELAAQTGGTGNYKLTIKPPATLTGNRVATFQNDVDANVKTDQTFAATPNSSAGAGNSIPVGTRQVAVGAVANNADDFIVLPAIASVNIGDQIVIACNAGGAFELRTPASSGTTINGQDCDGTKEYLCTDTDVVIVTKATATGWIGQSLTSLGAVRTAVVPD